jgi:hypothetical protein
MNISLSELSLRVVSRQTAFDPNSTLWRDEPIGSS